ncbi:XK-related protein 7-like [Onthophagus taurus]|uniref:XK-related protein 7-like n=1 Tax=Onthophagus taurus TaxID=166361 RepID=UPI000C20A765|nr:XK-related protein 7-like [Onthophagus taurus]
MAEFLPLCDLLFNVVSLAVYFCDFVFDILVIYALYEKELFIVFAQCLTMVFLSTIISQILSLRWYLSRKKTTVNKPILAFIHVIQLGVLWRYTRLLAPIQLSSVKQDVRDLCILRLLHGFIQAAPMLLLQLSLLSEKSEMIPSRDLIIVSATLSLFSICWSLASFSKHVQSVERFVLTWLGVISQLLWRAGTVTSRALALAAYAASYKSWIFLVLALHWTCMFLWLISPKSAYHGQKGSRLGICVLIAAIYILAYINFQDKPHTRTMTVFYIVMLMENSLLITAWMAAIWSSPPINWELIPILTLVLFMVGIFFMLIYYRFFHVRRLMDKPSTPPGVFNCRFANPTAAALYRKKKKPTSFVPPPGLTPVPFWRRPLPSSSENEGSSVGSRVNIHQKLQEKKQKQLAELKIIEEEIKQGKLVGPEAGDPDDRQPIPRAKRHVEPQLISLASLNNLASYGVNLNRRPPPRAPTRSRTPELLLAPRYLYCDCVVPEPAEPVEITAPPTTSDIESQISLPRSYTLPREFKYYRRGRSRKPIHPVPSTNSSDGDVDSADDESDYQTPPVVVKQLRRPFRHETKL